MTYFLDEALALIPRLRRQNPPHLVESSTIAAFDNRLFAILNQVLAGANGFVIKYCASIGAGIL